MAQCHVLLLGCAGSSGSYTWRSCDGSDAGYVAAVAAPSPPVLQSLARAAACCQRWLEHCQGKEWGPDPHSSLDARGTNQEPPTSQVEPNLSNALTQPRDGVEHEEALSCRQAPAGMQVAGRGLAGIDTAGLDLSLRV